MKSIHLTFHQGKDAPKSGLRTVPLSDDSGRTRVHDSEGTWFLKASSAKIHRFFDKGCYQERESWAQLTIIIDDIELSFWVPEELDYVCDVFSIVPFPTALTLANHDPDENRLNGHWLSRLPKKAKMKKFRDRFIKYVKSEPKELQEFRSFYMN